MTGTNKIANAVLAIVMIVFMTLFLMIIAEAKTHDGMFSRDAHGNIYISQTGWVRIGNHTYYSHKTRSRLYGKNEICRNTYRWRNGKLYYFDGTGRAIRHSTKYIKLNRDRTVKYIITPGSGGRERYSTKAKRYQIRENGKWRDTGNQTNIWWMCDWQL